MESANAGNKRKAARGRSASGRVGDFIELPTVLIENDLELA
jgi:hypothetical protein